MGTRKIVGENGDPCPRCGKPTEIREHREVTEKQLQQPFYYSRWFYCTNRRCRTNRRSTPTATQETPKAPGR